MTALHLTTKWQVRAIKLQINIFHNHPTWWASLRLGWWVTWRKWSRNIDLFFWFMKSWKSGNWFFETFCETFWMRMLFTRFRFFTSWRIVITFHPFATFIEWWIFNRFKAYRVQSWWFLKGSNSVLLREIVKRSQILEGVPRISTVVRQRLTHFSSFGHA